MDHGPEFDDQVLDSWVYEAYIESFNGKVRDECLSEHWFVTMVQARRIIEAWRVEYNTERTHSSDRRIGRTAAAINVTAYRQICPFTPTGFSGGLDESVSGISDDKSAVLSCCSRNLQSKWPLD